ncbi:MAG: GGDEF domain-containing protein [Solirubrobacterales bacterium]
MNNIKHLTEKLMIFDQLYDNFRIVDPVNKKVFNLDGEELKISEHICFAFWDKETVCDNCISIRVIEENKSLIKLEKKGDRLLMVTSVPLKQNESTVVVELLKDVTDSIMFSEGVIAESSTAFNIINNLNNLVSKDPLTGIFNRRYVNERLPVDMLKLLESGESLSVIMADIDFFKRVNDEYGHIAVDEVLKEFASLLETSLSKAGDWVARLGGEEFLMCLSGTGREKALIEAERIRKKVEEMKIEYKGITIKITASFGVSNIDIDILNNNKEYKFEMLIEKADENLYAAKQTGRNKVV